MKEVIDGQRYQIKNLIQDKRELEAKVDLTLRDTVSDKYILWEESTNKNMLNARSLSTLNE